MVVEVVVEEEEEDVSTTTERYNEDLVGDEVDVELEEGVGTGAEGSASALSTSSWLQSSPPRKSSPIELKGTSSTGERQTSTLSDPEGGNEKNSVPAGDGAA